MNTSISNAFRPKTMLIVAFIMAFVGVSDIFSQASNVYKVQSLFLYNFSKHVKWENSANEIFTIGVYGNSVAYAEIKKNLGSKSIWGKNIKVVEINSTQGLSDCHLAYMPKSNKKKILAFIGKTELSNTLLVTEDDLMKDGAAISFVYDQSKMKFKISKAKIEQVGLKVSSTLISIGISV
jgi:hypothetical protein